MTRRAAALLLFAAALAPAFFWLSPALLSGKAPIFRDQGDFFLPLKLWTADRLKAGEVPLWNPLSGGGEPWLANGQAGPFYPPTWLFLLPSPALAAALFLLLHFSLGAAGTWRFLREEGGSDGACGFGAAVFAGCGFAGSLAAFWNHFGGWCWLPWVALLARSGLRTRRKVAGLAAAVGLQAMAGSPEMSLVSILLAVVLAFSPRSAEPPADGWRTEPEGNPRWRLAAGVVLGLGLAAWSLLPLAELSAGSARRDSLPVEQREAGALTIQAGPSAVGLPSAGPASTWVHSVFVSAAALFAVAAAFSERERRRLVFVLLAAAAVGLLLSFAGPPGAWIRALPPFDRFRYPAKFAGLSVFALAVLAGIGADALRFRRVPVRLAALGGLIATALAVISAARFGRPAAAVTAALLALAALAGSERLRGIFLGMSVLALAATLGIAGRPLFSFAPEGELRRVATSIPFLRTVGGRVLTPPMGELARWALREDRYDSATLARQREALVGYTNLLAGVPTLRTAAPLPTAIAADVERAVDASDVPRGPAGAAGARVVWSPFPPPDMGSRRVGEFYRAPIEPWRPRVTFSLRAQVEPDARRARELSLSGASDFRRELSIDRPGPGPGPGAAAGSPDLFVASLVEDRPERVVLSVENRAAGYLVLADAWDRGWNARIDGRKGDLYRADGMFRAVHLPPGSHRVVFSYRPLSVFLGAGISVASLAAMVALSLARGPRVGRSAA